ncbi:MAG TPA: hypothetical protein DCF44_02080 [Chitinophagaceae bacterium]|nr:hypothetical protein [Chitinophagaceae bacterium]
MHTRYKVGNEVKVKESEWVRNLVLHKMQKNVDESITHNSGLFNVETINCRKSENQVGKYDKNHQICS